MALPWRFLHREMVGLTQREIGNMGVEKRGIIVIMLAAIVLIHEGNSVVKATSINSGPGHGWEFGHATFYGDMSGHETMEGACGYGDLFQQGYGLETTALSAALFNDGWTCGACYQITCHNSTWCLPGHPSIRVTATNFCPANYSKPSENWCNPPQKHFDLSQPMFRRIAEYRGGIIPVAYRRVMCYKKGGVKFQIKGNPYWILVLVYNVGGVGDVEDVKVRGSDGEGWAQMTRSWGQNWVTSEPLVGKTMSFQVTTSDGRMVQSDDVVPSSWKFGDTYDGRQFD